MNIIIPFNVDYIKKRYGMSDSYIDMLTTLVLPDMISRYSFDSRVESIELMSNVNIDTLNLISDKIIFNKCEIGNTFDANEVAYKILSLRKSKSNIVVQCNPLYPFISINSLHRAFASVSSGYVSSAVGSVVNKAIVNDKDLAKEYDLGIFNVYNAEDLTSKSNRVTVPFDAVGLRAVELICLRNSADLELFNLIVNSGFEL